MPHWLIKSAIHRVISGLPRPQFWNGLLQTCFTKSITLTRSIFEDKVAECHRHFHALISSHSPLAEFSAVELGTGWFPTIPVGLYLCGARELWTVDIKPLLRPAAVRQVLRYYSDAEQSGVLQRILPERRPERIQALRSILSQPASKSASSLLEDFKIHVLVADAQSTPIPERTVKFFFSSGVLQYIPRPVLRGILAEFKRISAPGAVMSHRINLRDEYSLFDHSISPFNFLRYTEKQWRWRNSPLIWQNRLRISDYRQLLTEAGFHLIGEESTAGREEDLARIKLAPEFQDYARDDILVLHSYLTARL